MRNKVFAMFANSHHNDGHIAVWIPAQSGLQAVLISTRPRNSSSRLMSACAAGLASSWMKSATKQLADYVCGAWRLIAPKKAQTASEQSFAR